MADIDNPVAVRWSNERVRTIADQVTRTLRQIDAYLAEWDAGALADLFPVSADPVIDGSPDDGRLSITGNDVRVLTNQLAAIQSLADDNGGALRAAFLRVQVNGTTR